MKTVWIVGTLALAACAPVVNAQMKKVDDYRLSKSIAEYDQAATTLDKCVKAKLVAIAYEDARDATNGAAWHAREREHCEAAVAELRGGR